jgi:aspartate racemase
MKRIGIIGGLGPETTANFYLEIISYCKKLDHVSRPPVLLWSVPLEYQIEQDLLLHSNGEEKYIPYLVEGAQTLEKGGADFIVLPCNSLHIFIDEIRAAVKIPVLSIVEETVTFLSHIGAKEVGILATSTTLHHQLYKGHLQDSGMAQVEPTDEEQAKINYIISRLAVSEHTPEDKLELLNIIDRFLESEVQHIILACTDLQLTIRDQNYLKIYDTMKILAHATVRESLGVRL